MPEMNADYSVCRRNCVGGRALQGVTSHKADFQRWVVEPVRVTMKDKYEPVAEPFDGLATYTTAYVRHSQPVRPSMKPDQSAAISDAPLQVQHLGRLK